MANDISNTVSTSTFKSRNKSANVSETILSRCLLLNARSLRNKLPELQALLSVKCPSIVFATESWLDSNISDNTIALSENYVVYRHDRAMRIGGGVLAIVSNKLHSYEILIPKQFNFVELECFEVVADCGTYRFIVLYRPPEFNLLGRDYVKRMIECLVYFCNTNNTVFIVGDFNLPKVDWAMSTAPDDDIHSSFLKFCVDYGFSQYVSTPTRDSHILDLVLCNDPYAVSNIVVTEPFSNSDHCMVEFDLVFKVCEQPLTNATYYDFRFADADAIALALSEHPFHFSDPSGSVDDAWSQFIEPVYEAIENYVPVRAKQPFSNVSKRKKYPRHIVRAMRKKSILWRRYHSSKTMANKAAYSKQTEICKSLVFEYERSKELEVIKKSSIGAFYRYVNKRLIAKSGVGPLRPSASSDVIVTDDSTKASMLNEYFTSVFVSDDGSFPDFNRRVPDNVFIDSISVTPDRILHFINMSKAGSSPGPDDVPMMFVKQFKFQLLQPLFVLCRYLTVSGQIPSDWKLANITPVLKNGLASDVSNYRPISLTSVFCKLFERVIHEQMLSYLLHNNLISSHQHGFLVKHSTCTQLLESVNDWSLGLRNSNIVDVVYFDIAKAFDTVSHVKLTLKLQAYGVSGSLLSLIEDFLNGRSQRVKLPGGLSSWRPVVSGVPQGSVLGPLLFLLYINDVADSFPGNVSIKLFADDIKVYMEIENNLDVAIFQQSINEVLKWATKWQLKLSYSKCCFMRVSLRRSATDACYTLNNSPLSRVSFCADLGVCMDSSLSFSKHINNVTVKAKQRASLLLRCFISKDPVILMKAFTVYVRPLLEYCSPVWSPCSVCNINLLESVQRCFTKRLLGMRNLSYEDRLKVLGLERLELRRLHADLITCYKIIHGLISIPFESFFQFNLQQNTRGHSLKLHYPDSRVTARAHSFAVRVILLWNRLPASVVLAENIHKFKKLLKSIDLSYAMLGKS